MAKKHIDPMSESHRKRVYARFVNDIFPKIGGRPIAEITAKELLDQILKIENRGAGDTAHRTLGSCGRFSDTQFQPAGAIGILRVIFVGR